MIVRPMIEKRMGLESGLGVADWNEESGGPSSFLKRGSESDISSPVSSLVPAVIPKSTSSNRPERECGVLGTKPSVSKCEELTDLNGMEVIWRTGFLLKD